MLWKRTSPSPAGNDGCGKLSTLLCNLLCPTCHKYREGGSAVSVCVCTPVLFCCSSTWSRDALFVWWARYPWNALVHRHNLTLLLSSVYIRSSLLSAGTCTWCGFKLNGSSGGSRKGSVGVWCSRMYWICQGETAAEKVRETLASVNSKYIFAFQHSNMLISRLYSQGCNVVSYM